MTADPIEVALKLVAEVRDHRPSLCEMFPIVPALADVVERLVADQARLVDEAIPELELLDQIHDIATKSDERKAALETACGIMTQSAELMTEIEAERDALAAEVERLTTDRDDWKEAHRKLAMRPQSAASPATKEQR